MKAKLNQTGFATWELLFALVVVAVVAFAGYHVYSAHQAATNTTAATTSAGASGSTSTSVPAAPKISDNTGLDQAMAALNQTDPSSSNASDSSQLSSQANF